MSESSLSEKVVLVSAFGRGAALAVKLAGEGYQVTILDVSRTLGEDTDEGPFPCFWEDLEPIESESLKQSGQRITLSQGLCLMSPQGPIELKKGWAGEATKFFAPFDGRDWQDEFLYQYFAVTAKPNSLPIKAMVPMNPDQWSGLQTYRVMARTDFTMTYAWAEKHGVQTLPLTTELKDLAFAKKRGAQHQLEVTTGPQNPSQILQVDHLVWCLSGEETQYVNPGLAKKVYPRGIVACELFWQKIDLTVQVSPEGEGAAPLIAWIKDPELHWLRDNFFVIVPTLISERVELWFKMPLFHRGHVWEEQKIMHEILSHLQERLPAHDFQLVPRLGAETADRFPPRFPIYNETARITDDMIVVPQFSYLGAEKRLAWGSNGWFQMERLEFQKIDTYFKKLREKKHKRTKELSP